MSVDRRQRAFEAEGVQLDPPATVRIPIICCEFGAICGKRLQTYLILTAVCRRIFPGVTDWIGATDVAFGRRNACR